MHMPDSQCTEQALLQRDEVHQDSRRRGHAGHNRTDRWVPALRMRKSICFSEARTSAARLRIEVESARSSCFTTTLPYTPYIQYSLLLARPPLPHIRVEPAQSRTNAPATTFNVPSKYAGPRTQKRCTISLSSTPTHTTQKNKKKKTQIKEKKRTNKRATIL